MNMKHAQIYGESYLAILHTMRQEADVKFNHRLSAAITLVIDEMIGLPPIMCKKQVQCYTDLLHKSIQRVAAD